jgi:hypothetical protein
MELTRSFSAGQFARALESWDWADIQGRQPLFTSPFGDVFFQAQDGFWSGSRSSRWARRRSRCS